MVKQYMGVGTGNWSPRPHADETEPPHSCRNCRTPTGVSAIKCKNDKEES